MKHLTPTERQAERLRIADRLMTWARKLEEGHDLGECRHHIEGLAIDLDFLSDGIDPFGEDESQEAAA